MSWNESYTKENPPSFTEVSEYIQTNEWETLFTELTEKIGATPKLEHSRCSIPGWNMKFKKKGKNLCTVYPQENQFQLLVIANKQFQEEIEAVVKECDPRIQKAYHKDDFMNGGKWLIYEVDSPEILEDTLRLIQFRLL